MKRLAIPFLFLLALLPAPAASNLPPSNVLLLDEKGALAGIFSERDLLMKVAGKHEIFASTFIREFMTPDPVTVRESDTLAFALHKMAIGGYRHLPVMRDQKLVGMVSVRDMLAHITRICDKPGTGVLDDG